MKKTSNGQVFKNEIFKEQKLTIRQRTLDCELNACRLARFPSGSPGRHAPGVATMSEKTASG
jgi:hypothetical protein